MPFAPHEIEHKRFVVGLRGYATHEVDAFLRAVAADYRALLEGGERGEWSAQLENVVHVAADAAAKSRTEAELTAREIIENAERQAAELQANAQRDYDERRNEVMRRTDELRRLEDRLRDELSMIEAAIGLVRDEFEHPDRRLLVAPELDASVDFLEDQPAPLARDA